jgi:hypothetical protein
MSEPSYLGDGLYASHDGIHFWLAANHPQSDKRVALEPAVLEAFLRYVESTLGCTITIQFPPAQADT